MEANRIQLEAGIVFLFAVLISIFYWRNYFMACTN